MRHLSRLTSDFENKENTVKKYLKIKKRFGIFFILNVTIPLRAINFSCHKIPKSNRQVAL